MNVLRLFTSWALAALLLVSCGEHASVDAARLPERLRDATPRLEAAGYEVAAVDVGRTEVVPGLRIERDDEVVVVAIGPGLGETDDLRTALSVETAAGEEVETNLRIICSDRVYLAAPPSSSHALDRVSRILRLC